MRHPDTIDDGLGCQRMLILISAKRHFKWVFLSATKL